MRSHHSFFIGFACALIALVSVSVVALAADRKPPLANGNPGSQTVNGAELAAFKAATKPSDRAPRRVIAAAMTLDAGSADVAATLRPGLIAVERSRMLVADGSGSAKIFGFPTDAGKLCYVVVAGPAGCEDQVSRSRASWGMYDPDAVGSGAAVSVYGFVTDDAQRVSVTVDGTAIEARLGRNAFYLQLPAASSVATSIVTSYRDGSTSSIDLAPPPTP